MYRKVVLATLLGIALATATVSSAAAWTSTHVYYSALVWNYHYPDTAWDPVFSQDGCDDYWSQWNSVPKAKVPNTLRLNSYNLVTDAAGILHQGFDGAYECGLVSCKVKLCNTDTWGANPWSIRLASW